MAFEIVMFLLAVSLPVWFVAEQVKPWQRAVKSPKNFFLAVVVLATTLALIAIHAWAAGPGQIVTLAEEQTFPAATNPNTCKVFEFDPIEMKKFSRVTFVGRGHGPNPPQFSIIYLFSLEPVKFSVPAPSGTGIGGQCDAWPAHDTGGGSFVFPPNNQLACQPLQGGQGG
jgi:hypothetical protein